MELTAKLNVSNIPLYQKEWKQKLLRIMKLTAILMLAFCMHIGAAGHGQRVSLSLKEVSLKTVFFELNKQTGFNFLYSDEALSTAKKVTIEVKNVTIEDILTLCFKDQPLAFTIENNSIVIIPKPKHKIISEVQEPPAFEKITGTVLDKEGKPISSVSVINEKTSEGTSTDDQGNFSINVTIGDVLIFSSVGFEKQFFTIKNTSQITVTLNKLLSKLDEVQITAYGTTTRKFNTGNVSSVKAEEIERQPVMNPLITLQGRVPGVEVTQNNGLPGSFINVLIRGKSSLFSGTAPMFVLDGVPFLQSLPVTNLNTATGTSPLNAISPTDIESIEVLKDADATAIYGSQGANGVILITTKKAAQNKTQAEINYYTGFGKPARVAKPMNTQQYLSMRKEGFKNDGTNPTISNAPDLLLWDSTAYTNWQDELTGGTARTNNVHASISGGTGGTRFLVSGNYNGQTTVFPESKPAQRLGAYVNLTHHTRDNKFRVQFSNTYSDFHIKAPLTDLSSQVYLPPNAPAVYDSAGNLNWIGWTGADNPMAQLERSYDGHTYTLNTNLKLEYRIVPSLTIKVSGGYNQIRQDEYRNSPIKSKRPSAAARGEADWQNSWLKSWIAEPQLLYEKKHGSLYSEFTAGLSFQQRKQQSLNFSGTQYKDDDMLRNPLAAGASTVAYSFREYKYTALFGRAVFRWKDRYLLSLNGRRDGSSRYGPEVRYANFGSMGAAWIFSDEPWLKNILPIFSYGKLRGSYGVTGNDQVGDYAFLDAWNTPATGNYQGNVTIAPSNLFNPYLQWERNRKLELALETGLFKNRIFLNVAWYRNRSDNQLIGYNLPTQTGFSNIRANLDALLENSGWELELNTKNMVGKSFQWQTMINITIPRSKLISYPGLEQSINRYTYAIGEPLYVQFGYIYEGINPQTSTYQFNDINKDGQINTTGDYQVIGQIQPTCYGGINNILQYKNFELEIFLQAVKQTGKNYLTSLVTVPGNFGNQPTLILNENIQKYTAAGTGAVNNAHRNYRQSSAQLSDASYMRLKNLSLSYSLPARALSKLHARQMRLYVQGQNLFTITGYKGADPETQHMISLPPIRMLVFGLSLGL